MVSSNRLSVNKQITDYRTSLGDLFEVIILNLV